MSTIIKSLIFYLSLISCTNFEYNKVNCIIKLSNDELNFELNNNSNANYLIPINYEYNSVNDSIIFESHYKSEITEYNDFGLPKFKSLKSKSKIDGKIGIEKDIKDKKILFRVYSNSVENYAKEKKLKKMTEIDFLEYEKSNSFLIEGVSR
jgi:hypothetical protein